MVTQQEINSQQEALRRRQRDLSTASAIRGTSRDTLTQRNQQLSQISQAQSQLQSQSQELSRLETQQSQAQDRISRLTNIIRSGLKGNVGKSFSNLNKNDQRLVTQIISEITDANLPASSLSKTKADILASGQGIQSLPGGKVLLKSGDVIDTNTGNLVKNLNIKDIQSSATFQSLVGQPSVNPFASKTSTEQRLQQSLAVQQTPVTNTQVIQKQNNLLKRLEDSGVLTRNNSGEITIDIGGNIRRGAERFTGAIEKGIVSPTIKTLRQRGFKRLADVLDIKSPISSGELAIGLIFEPAFATGTAGTSSAYVQDQVTGRFLTKKEASDLAQRRLKELLESGIDVIKVGNERISVREITRKLIDKNSSKPENLLKLRQFFKSSGRTELFDDILAQEGLTSIAKSSLAKELVKDLPPSIKGASSLVVASRTSTKTSTLSGSGAENKFRGSTFAGTGQFEKTNVVGINSNFRNQALSKLNEIPKQLNELRNNQRFEVAQLIRQLQNQGVSQLEINKEATKLREQQQQKYDQAVKQGQEFRQKTIQQLNQKLKQQTQQRNRQRNRTRLSPRLRLRPRNPLGLPITSSPFKKKIKTLVTQRNSKGYDVFARKKGKLTKIGSVKGSKKQAQDYLAFKLDTTLRASGLIKPTTSKKLKPISTSITGYLSRNKKKFYTSKKGLLTEKRNFRLEKRGSETKRIQQLRKPRLKSTKMIRKKQ